MLQFTSEIRIRLDAGLRGLFAECTSALFERKDASNGAHRSGIGRFAAWAERTRTFLALKGASFEQRESVLSLSRPMDEAHPVLSRITPAEWTVIPADPNDPGLEQGFSAADLSIGLVISDGSVMHSLSAERMELLVAEIARVIAPGGYAVLDVPKCSDIATIRMTLGAHGFEAIKVAKLHPFDTNPKVVGRSKTSMNLADLRIEGDVLENYPAVEQPKVFEPRHCTGAYDRKGFGHDMLDHGLFDTFPEDDMEGEGKEQYNKGVICYERGDIDEAAACFRAAIDLAPGALPALNNLAICQLQSGRLDEGLRALLELEAQAPEEGHVLRNIAIVYMMRDDNARALEYLDRAEAVDPENQEIEFLRATIHERAGAFEEAIACMQRVLESDPDCAAAMDNLGALLSAVGRHVEAIPHLVRACELEPNEPSAHYNLAKAFVAIGRFDDAIERFLAHLELAPDHSCAICELGAALSDAGRHDEAISRFREYLELEPDDPNGHGGIGIEFIRARRFAEAEHHLREAYRLEPTSSRVVLALGSLADAKGRFREAMALYREAAARDSQDDAPRACLLRMLGMKLHPRLALEELRTNAKDGDAANYWALVGWLESSGDREKALEVSEEMVRKFPADHCAHGCHGLMLEAAGRRDAALEQFKSALKLNSDDLVAHFHSGRILCESNRFSEGIPVLEYVLERSPRSLDAMRLLAWAHSMIGERHHGRGYAQRILTESPEDEFARKLLEDGKNEP